MRVRSLVWKDPLEEVMATHFSILAWRIPWTEEPGQLFWLLWLIHSGRELEQTPGDGEDREVWCTAVCGVTESDTT